MLRILHQCGSYRATCTAAAAFCLMLTWWFLAVVSETDPKDSDAHLKPEEMLRFASHGLSVVSSALPNADGLSYADYESIITPLLDRRLVSMPHALLFRQDVGLRRLLDLAAVCEPSNRQPGKCRCRSVQHDLSNTKQSILSHVIPGSLTHCVVPRRVRFLEDKSGNESRPWWKLGFMTVHLQNSSAIITQRKLSRDPVVEQWLREVIGPLDFDVFVKLRFEESARLVHHRSSGFAVFDNSNKRYVIFYPLSHVASDTSKREVPTAFSLSVQVRHDNYWAVDEYFHKTLHRRKASHSTLISASKEWVTVHDGNDSSQPIEIDGVNIAFLSDFLTGWWWSTWVKKELFPWPWYRGAPLWYGVNDSLSSPTPSAFLVSSQSRRRESCDAAVSVMITGDSQSRSLYRGVTNFVESLARTENSTKHPTTTANKTELLDSAGKLRKADADRHHGLLHFETMRNGKQVVMSLAVPHVAYRWDDYLNNISKTLEESLAMASADASPIPATVLMCAGMGAHPASWGQYSFLKFQAEMSRIATNVNKFLNLEPQSGPARQVQWYGAPAWPKPKEYDNFRVTNSRLGLFNYIAAFALRDAGRQSCGSGMEDKGYCGVRHTDFFGMTLSVRKWSRDGSHYDKSVVIPSMAERFLRSTLR